MIALGARRNVERLDFARHPHRFLGCDAEGVDQATHFAFGILDRLARLNA
jgi:hypothetical protein